MDSSAKKSSLEKAAAFLNEIGLSVIHRPGAAGFLDRVAIREGTLEIDPGCHVSDLLHEAGHLAVIPSQFRHLMSGDLHEGLETMFNWVQKNAEIDSPMYWMAIQSGEQEAAAWSFAAGVHLGFDPHEIILSEQFQGQGDHVRFGLHAGMHLGIHGLFHAGFCAVPTNFSSRSGLPIYPKLRMWLQH